MCDPIQVTQLGLGEHFCCNTAMDKALLLIDLQHITCVCIDIYT